MASNPIVPIGAGAIVGTVDLKYPSELGEIGAAKERVDRTSLKDTVRKYADGVQNLDEYPITNIFEDGESDSDYRALLAIENAKQAVPLVIYMPNEGGKYTTWTNSGYVTTRVSGATVNGMTTMTLSINLQEAWTIAHDVAKPTPAAGRSAPAPASENEAEN